MKLLHAIQLATDIYLKKAYPEGAPAGILSKADSLHQFHTVQELMGWGDLEHEKNRHSLRLGNKNYPHMKLVFMIKGNCNLFYVDAHDSHFEVNKDTPGYEGLVALRKVNKKLKKSIESTWMSENLPVFGGKIDLSGCENQHWTLDVLALDDEAQILDMLCMCSRSIGSNLECATTVSQAIKSIEEHRPDVVLCDIMMPEESGYDLVNWIRAKDTKLPIYYLTGLNIDKVDTTGVNGVLQKPFTVKDLGEIFHEVATQKTGNAAS